MTDTTQAARDERIGILNSVGVGMPARAELAGLDVDPAVLRTAARRAYAEGKRGDQIVEAIRSMLNEHAATTPDAGPPGGEPAAVPDAEEPAPNSRAEAKVDESCTGGNGDDGRNGMRTTDGDEKLESTMTVTTAGTMPALDEKVSPKPARRGAAKGKRQGGSPAKVEGPTTPLKLVGQGDSATTTQELARKSDQHLSDLPAKAEDQDSDDIRPRLIDAASAARLCGVSKSGWWAFHASGRCPLPVRLGRATRWRQDELSDWIDAGCPARVKWKWKSGQRRSVGS